MRRLQARVARCLRSHLLNGSSLCRWFYHFCHKIAYTVKFFFRNGLSDQVYSLSFSTMFAIVPIAAVLMAIGRGFGFADYMEREFRSFLSSQPQVADTILQFASNYLANNQNYVIVGAGFIFMLYTVVSLFYNIEHVFNSIWQVARSRSLGRMIVDYTALTLFFAVAIIVTAGLTVLVGGYVDRLLNGWVLLPLAKIAGPCLQVVAMWLAFLFLYTFMPNVKVPVVSALVPSLLSAVGMIGFQYLYVWVQYALSSYNAIYGSVAILPLFMIWLMIDWYICLFGAQLTFVNQYGSDMKSFQFQASELCVRHKLIAMLLILSVTTRESLRDHRPTLSSLSTMTGVPLRIAHDLVNELIASGLMHEIVNEDEKGAHRYAVDLGIMKKSVGEIIDRLETRVGKSISDRRFINIIKEEPMLKSLGKVDSRFPKEWQTVTIDKLCETTRDRI
ncbi:MAG: YihY/virulence factor BrkB family protein [Prevotella sp.]